MTNTFPRNAKYFAIAIILMCIFNNIFLTYINNTSVYYTVDDISIANNEIRKMNIEPDFSQINQVATSYNVTPGQLVTMLLSINNYTINPQSLNMLSNYDNIKLYNKLMKINPKEFIRTSNIIDNIYNDMNYFPIPQSTVRSSWVNYVNSWGNERTYGGSRTHEGTDIMADENTPGLYPVVSVSNGTVSSIGWLELGGYRVGITSNSGIYYYYAHLDSFADIEVGENIRAGQLIGFMGNTGYSKIPGTSGHFDVHLHFGIYITLDDDTEISLNPYIFLNSCKKKILYYKY